MKPTRPPATMATTIIKIPLVTFALFMAPMTQAQNTAFAPTDRSMPAVIRQSSMPVARKALKAVCFRMPMRLL